MIKSPERVWKSETAKQFAGALTSISEVKDMQNFLRDAMTEKEIIEISSRLEAARLLKDGARYIEVINKTQLSSRTVARISDWLQNGCGGYQKVLSPAHHTHL